MNTLKDLKLHDIKKLNALNEAELKTELKSSEKRYFQIKMKKQLGELKQTHIIKFLRRYIARINTIASVKWFNI